jgi:hypothetical protein
MPWCRRSSKPCPSRRVPRLRVAFEAHAEAARTTMLHADISDVVLASFERDVARNQALLQGTHEGQTMLETPSTVDALLLTATRITTFSGRAHADQRQRLLLPPR